jgi:hypothetical protein
VRRFDELSITEPPARPIIPIFDKRLAGYDCGKPCQAPSAISLITGIDTLVRELSPILYNRSSGKIKPRVNRGAFVFKLWYVSNLAVTHALCYICSPRSKVYVRKHYIYVQIRRGRGGAQGKNEIPRVWRMSHGKSGLIRIETDQVPTQVVSGTNLNHSGRVFKNRKYGGEGGGEGEAICSSEGRS